jgi:hypothetical protein
VEDLLAAVLCHDLEDLIEAPAESLVDDLTFLAHKLAELVVAF